MNINPNWAQGTEHIDSIITLTRQLGKIPLSSKSIDSIIELIAKKRSPADLTLEERKAAAIVMRLYDLSHGNCNSDKKYLS